jgi:hypothetical protein
MRWSVAALIALSLAFWSVGSQACNCLDHPHPVMHRVWAHHAWHRHWSARQFAGCPIALAYEIRPGCDWYSQESIGIR